MRFFAITPEDLEGLLTWVYLDTANYINTPQRDRKYANLEEHRKAVLQTRINEAVSNGSLRPKQSRVILEDWD